MFNTKRKAVFLLILVLTFTGCSSQSQNNSAQTVELGQVYAEFHNHTAQQADIESQSLAAEQINTEPQSLVTEQTDTDSQNPPSEQAGLSAGENLIEDASYDFTICFAGDINLDESWGTTQHMDAQPNGIYDCISEEMIDTMLNADIMCLNNEFTYSMGGAPMEGKAYTFRANPERVEILHQLGVDAVTLANNHVYDY